MKKILEDISKELDKIEILAREMRRANELGELMADSLLGKECSICNQRRKGDVELNFGDKCSVCSKKNFCRKCEAEVNGRDLKAGEESICANCV